jgi:hypothetical protein
MSTAILILGIPRLGIRRHESDGIAQNDGWHMPLHNYESTPLARS